MLFKNYNLLWVEIVWGSRSYQQYFSYVMVTVHKSMFPRLFQPVLNQSIIPTLVVQLQCYSHNPERQGGKPLLPASKTGLSHLGIEPLTSCSQGRRSKHYPTAAVLRVENILAQIVRFIYLYHYEKNLA